MARFGVFLVGVFFFIEGGAVVLLFLFVFGFFNLVLPELDLEHTPPIPLFQLVLCEVQCKKNPNTMAF